jgi:hypothetical protein
MISKKDGQVLRELAKQVAHIASLPIMEERREMWRQHNRLEPVRPMILVFPEGSWRELLPQSALCCEGDQARGMEWELRSRIYQHEYIHDDKPIEKTWVVNKVITDTGWGLEPKHIDSSAPTGAWGFYPVINEPKDLDKLKFPEVIYDEEATQENYENARELFGDILDVKLKGTAL